MSDSEIKMPERPKRKKLPSTGKLLGFTFGLFMVCVYVGMGILLLINFFQWQPSYDWVRYMMFPILVAYGIFRGWRAYKQLNQYTDDDDE